MSYNWPCVIKFSGFGGLALDDRAGPMKDLYMTVLYEDSNGKLSLIHSQLIQILQLGHDSPRSCALVESTMLADEK